MSLLKNVALSALIASCALFGSSSVLADNASIPQLADNWNATVEILVVTPNGMTKGSGSVLTSSGYILTAEHVIHGHTGLHVLVYEGRKVKHRLQAHVVAVDVINDLAVIKVLKHHFPVHVTLSSVDEIYLGLQVYNVGFPYSLGKRLGMGYLMQVHLHIPPGGQGDIMSDFIMIDIPDGPGTSGSGIFSQEDGNLVGVMRLMQGFRGPLGSVELIRRATPVNKVIKLLKRAKIPYSTSNGFVRPN